VGPIYVQWNSTNNSYLYLEDNLAMLTTNIALLSNSVVSIDVQEPTTAYSPTNYTIFRSAGPRSDLPLGTLASYNNSPPPINAGTNIVVNTLFTAYAVQLAGSSAQPSSAPGGSVTNMLGRTEISADAQLDFSRARIDALNYLLLCSSNHFVGNTNSQISAPYADVYLGSTNGSLTISNLLGPTVSRINTGDTNIEMWSSMWTNLVVTMTPTSTNTATNTIFVLLVDSHLYSTIPSQLNNLMLRSTNVAGTLGSVVLNDVVDPMQGFLIDAQSLTIAANDPASPTPYGGIVLENSDFSENFVWSTALPDLSYLTNNGYIKVPNAIFFGGERISPYFSTSSSDWYSAFVNNGYILDSDTHIYADDVENTGYAVIDADYYGVDGSIAIQAQTVSLVGVYPNAYLWAPNGDISIFTTNLVVFGHEFTAGRALTLSVTNSITDFATNGIDSQNYFYAGAGFNLLCQGTNGDLLGTTVSNVAPEWAEVDNLWAAVDLGNTPAGYTNNVAIGHLILDGGQDCLFRFTGTQSAGVTNNAMYVDLLELYDYAATTDESGTNLINVQIDPHMKIYFGTALADGADISSQLNGANGGQFVLGTGSYNGIFSKTGLAKTGLAKTGVTQADLALKVVAVSGTPPKAAITWRTLPYANNYLYFKSDPASTNWQLLTNFASPPLGGPVTVTDPVDPSNPRFYRVRVDPNALLP
jgi:hypothetical protein